RLSLFVDAALSEGARLTPASREDGTGGRMKRRPEPKHPGPLPGRLRQAAAGSPGPRSRVLTGAVARRQTVSVWASFALEVGREDGMPEPGTGVPELGGPIAEHFELASSAQLGEPGEGVTHVRDVRKQRV